MADAINPQLATQVGDRSGESSPHFSLSRAREANFQRGLRSFMQYRDLGISAATGGRFDAKIVKAIPGHHEGAPWHRHDLEFQMVFVLTGWITLDYEGVGPVTLEPGDCVHQAPGIRHVEIGHSDDYEGVEITMPAKFQTVEVEAPTRRQE